MKAIILTAGQSKRLDPFYHSRAKSMIYIAGEYILETTLKQLKKAGIKEVILVVNHKLEGIKSYFQFGKMLDMKLEYRIQPEEKGIGNALMLCKDLISQNEEFLLVYGDVLRNGDSFSSLIKSSQRTDTEATAQVTHPPHDGDYGRVYLSHDMKITKLIERPEDTRLGNYIFAGSFILPYKTFDLLAEKKENMAQLFAELVNKDQMSASLWEDGWIDISLPWHILSANKMIMDSWKFTKIPETANIESNVNLKGNVYIGENVHISSGTTIVGPCYIGDNVYIGNNALIREYSSIGPNSQVGYGTEIKNSVIFGNTTVGRLSFIGDSVLGEKVQFGSNTVTINYNTTGGNIQFDTDEGKIDSGNEKLGSFIGDSAIIGTGHTIAPGLKIQPGRKIADKISISE